MGDRGSSTDDDGAPTSSDDGAPTSSDDAGSESGSDTGAEIDPGLFACDLPRTCLLEQVIFPGGETECAAEAVLSAAPAMILAEDTPGNAQCGTQSLIFLFGDGTALVQTRECLNPDLDSEEIEPEWGTVEPQQLCTVVLADGLAEACPCEEESCSDCQWDPWPGDCGEGCTPGELADCEPIETPYDCAALTAMLDG